MDDRAGHGGGSASGGSAMGGITRRGVLVAGFAVALLPAVLPGRVRAATLPPPAPLTAADRADLDRVATYLSSIHTMEARFMQTANNGAVTTGRLWVERPGRMRFEYDPPSPITLIADRFYVVYWDKQLHQISQVGLKSTPAWFLLRDPVTFGPEILVTRFERGADALRITVIERQHPDAGVLTMVFSDKPLRLRQWTIVDQQGKTTTVALTNEQFGMALDPKLFQYNDPYAKTPSGG